MRLDLLAKKGFRLSQDTLFEYLAITNV